MKLTKFLNLFFILGFPILLFSQDQFDRIYKTNDRQLIAIDALFAEDESYFVLSKLIPADRSLDSVGLNVTKLKPKGDVDWSMDYYFADSLEVEELGSIIISGDGNLMFTGIIKDTSLRNDKLIIKLDQTGNVIWANTVASEVTEDYRSGPTFLSPVNNSSIALFGTFKNAEQSSVLAVRVDTEGLVLWSQVMDAKSNDQDVDEDLGEMILGQDSTLLSVGSLNTTPRSVFFSKTDTIGQVIWSKSYSAMGDDTKGMEGYDLAELGDTSYVLVGAYSNSQTLVNSGLIMRIDSLGAIIWAKRISFGELFSRTISNNVSLLEDGNLVVSGNYLNPGAPIPVEYMVKISPFGTLIWGKQFDKTEGRLEFSDIGELMSTSNSGAAYISTVIDSVEGDSTRLIPHLVKVDSEGISSCEDTISLDILYDIAIVADTLIWETSLYDSIAEIETFAVPYGGYDVPILSLRDTAFCPGDPVIFLLDASIEGATSYLWYKADSPASILSTDSMYIATEIDVDYVASVRVEKDICFTLCDTTRLTEIEPPMAEILPNFSQYCDQRDIILEVRASGQIEAIEWSTGDLNVAGIRVKDLGNYSVTVTNQCGDTGEAQITLAESDLPPSDIIIVQSNDNNICSSGDIILSIASPPGLRDIVWSTGETGPQIRVADEGIYSVSATDDCMYPVTTSFEVKEDDFFQEVEIELVADIENCSEGQIVINLLGIGDVDVVNWSTGVSNVVRITVNEAGTYSVTALDICGGSHEASIEITPEQLFECGRRVGEPCPDDEENCLCFPNVFRPRSMQTLNASFGPDNRCPEITEYRLVIYNRWGKVVFESNSITDEWNGTDGTDDLQGDVYVYYVRYVSEGVEFVSKGDVTLIR